MKDPLIGFNLNFDIFLVLLIYNESNQNPFRYFNILDLIWNSETSVPDTNEYNEKHLLKYISFISKRTLKDSLIREKQFLKYPESASKI